MQVLVAKTETLLNEVAGTVTYTKGTPLSLQTGTQGSAYYLWSNAPETREGDIANLVDGGVNNHFHTDYSSEPPSGSHYLAVYLGEENTLERFTFSHTTRAGVQNDFPKSVDVYGSDDNVTYKYIGSASGMPQSAGTAWEFNGVMLSSYKYLRFNYHAPRGYWHMAEFDITPITGFTATVNDTYNSTVTVDAVTAAMNALHNGKRTANGISPTTGDVAAKLSALQTAYNALYTQYEATINARKTTLAQLATDTESLINQVGTVELAQESKLDLTTENLYCNAPYTAQNNNDYSAAYVEKLTDGSKTTFLHTDYSGNVATPHYLRVDLGDGSTVTKFKFNYSTRDNGNNCPTKIVVEGCNEADGEYTEIKTLTTADGLPNPGQNTNGGVAEDFESSVITMSAPYRYVRFRVTGVEGGGANFFVMSEFGFTTVRDDVTVNNAYKNFVTDELLLTTVHTTNSSKSMSTNALVTSVPLLDAQIADQQAVKATLEEAIEEAENNTAEHKTQLLKELLEVMGVAQTLYQEIALEGEVKDAYSPALTNADVAELIKEIQEAGTVYENVAATADEIIAAKDELNAVYERLKAIIEANFDGDRTELQQLINEVKAMYEPMAVETDKTIAIPLQSTNAGEAYYIWCNAPAGDSNGVAGLIDKNADGTANTNTFLGTNWGSDVDPYTHYIEIDLGAGTTIGKLSIDYTTRNSTHADQRPNAIKILGSNDKVNYTEITEITEGLAANANEKWSMGELLDLGGRYRYIRIAVGSDRGFFHMSDFNLYASLSNSLDEYYSTAEGLEFDALTLALETAEYAVGHYVTEAQYNAILDNLRSCYNVTKPVAEADYTDRNALSALVNDAKTLINEVVTTIVEFETPVLSTANVYCNADNSTNSSAGAGDKRGVAALFDGDVKTHLHTTFGNNAQDDDLDHYIRVDMGEGKTVQVFAFNYTGRSSNSGNDPATIVVQACNAIDGEWTTVETLTGLPTDGDSVNYTSPLIKMNAPYRYVRFMVTATQNDATTTYNEIAHKFFVLSEFGFTAYAAITMKDECAELVDEELVREAYNAMKAADEANSHYMLENEYKTVLEELQTAYDVLVAKKTNLLKELKELIDATTLLKNSLYEITSYTATDVALQYTDENAAGYLYCNAPETNSPWDSDNKGVDGCIDLTEGGDPKLDTFLHTEYGNDPSADGLDHYLRVDLGAEGATAYIEFGYVGRSGHETKSPETVIVEATNDLNGEWTTIKTLNLAQPSATAETKTGALGNGVAYRYWRFMVTDTHFDGYDGLGNHKFFALSDFNVYKCTDIVISSKLNNEYNPDIYIYTTAELVAEVEGAIASATQVYEDALSTVEDYNNAVEALQAEYDKLAEAIKYHDAPVRITSDENNPVLYKIISKRADDGSKVLRFDEPESNNVTIVDAKDNASYQAWYFVKGENGYLIKPFNGQGNMLGVEDTEDGLDKALITAGPAYVEWIFARSAVDGCTDYYYIYVNGTNHACLSHYGGFNLTTKLGIWAGGWNTNDAGSLFKFVDAEFENDNAHYYQLSDFADIVEYKTADTPEGTTVGAYVNGAAYSAAYTATTELISAGNTSDAAECRKAYTDLREACKTIQKIVPEEGKFYRIDITPGLTDARASASMQIDDNAKLACGEYNASNARFYFTFEYDDKGNLYMKNLHTGTYLDEANAHNSDVQVGADAEQRENAKSIAINTLGTSNGAVVVSIVPTGGAMLNCTAKPGAVKAWDNSAVDKASAWVISEVEDLSKIEHTVTMNATFSSVMLGYNATVPADVEAYNAEGVEGGYVSLVKIAVGGGVIPANTPVILYRTDDTKEKIFTYTEDDATNIPDKTVLGGSLYQKFVKCEENMDYYKLMIKGGEAKMYWMYKEFNAEGVSQGNTNDGGHIKCSANKIYMALPQREQAASYGMRFVTPGATDIDEMKSEDGMVKTIYDLQGRKLDEITEPGFYIVNGKKILVK